MKDRSYSLRETVIILDGIFFRELRKLSHNDEMRYKLLIYGVKRILGNKKKSGKVSRLFRTRIKTKPKWD